MAAKNVNNILNHVSGDDEKVQASLISKIIDKKGYQFADEVNRRSKALQENKKFSLSKPLHWSLIGATTTN